MGTLATARENGKKGGRPKGKKNEATLKKEAVLAAYRDRAMRHADLLLSGQLTVALGQTFLYKIEKEKIIGPKGGVSYKPKKPVLVTAQWEIEEYIESEACGSGANLNEPGATYYFITTKEPDGSVADSILDRTFGRSVQAVTVGGPNGENPFDEEHRKKAKKLIQDLVSGERA